VHPKARRVICIQARLVKVARDPMDPRARRAEKGKDLRLPIIHRLAKVAREAMDPRARRVTRGKDLKAGKDPKASMELET